MGKVSEVSSSLQIHYMTRSTWTPACPSSLSKIMGNNMELVPPLAFVTASTLFREGFPLDVGTLLRGLASIQPWALVRSGTDVGSQSAFQFIPKVFDGVEVRALCRPVKFFHTDLNKPFLYGPRFVHSGIVMLKQERAFPKMLPQSWMHRII